MDGYSLPLPDTLFQVLVWIIVVILLLTAGFLFAAVYRRVAQSRKYAKMDRYRAEYAREIPAAIDRGAVLDLPPKYAFRPASLRWDALEQVLFDLSARDSYRGAAKDLFLRLGYVAHYEKSLCRRNVLDRSAAIDKLGRMGSAASTERLLPLLAVRNGEIVTNTVRALGKIGTPAGLEGILARADDLLERRLLSRKVLETSLLSFGAAAIPSLVRAVHAGRDPVSRGSLLEVLSGLAAVEAVPVAARLLDDRNPETRSKALKLIGACGSGPGQPHRARVESLLADPVWFVRLHAAKTLGVVGGPDVAEKLGERLTDPNWQVRNAAATALTRLGEAAIPAFLAILGHTDRYAKESVCEEIEKTGFVDLLIANMERPGSAARDGSRRILAIMAALNYRTPHAEYLKTPAPEPARREIEHMLAGEIGA